MQCPKLQLQILLCFLDQAVWLFAIMSCAKKFYILYLTNLSTQIVPLNLKWKQDFYCSLRDWDECYVFSFPISFIGIQWKLFVNEESNWCCQNNSQFPFVKIQLNEGSYWQLFTSNVPTSFDNTCMRITFCEVLLQVSKWSANSEMETALATKLKRVTAFLYISIISGSWNTVHLILMIYNQT